MFMLLTAQNLPHMEQLSSCSGARLSRIALAVSGEKLSNTYTKVGINSQNTYLTINSDKTFSGKIDGKPISGQWSYTQEDQKLVLKTLLFSLNVYAKKTTGGMSFLMESKKLLNLFQTLAAMSGNSTLQTMGDLSKNYDGVRIGLDTHK